MFRTLILCLFLTTTSQAQRGSKQLISEYEDTLKIMAHRIMHEKIQSKKEIANQAFITTLKEVLKYDKSFLYPFDSLITISRVYAPDDSFRIFNWILKKQDGSYNYYGLVHYHNKKRKRYEIIELTDNSDNIRRPSEKELDNSNWYGALYYEIAHINKKGRKYYTLLGWDGINQYSTQKIIDVMYIYGKDKIKFGLPVFIKGKEKSHRVLLEHDEKTSISLRYQKKEKQIVFNHLVPIKQELQGLHEYYVPDGSFDAYIYKDGKWIYTADVDVRNDFTETKGKKPKMGLTPR